jgi:hypothetical protein
MAIVRVSTTQKNAAIVPIQACIYGIECDLIEAEDPAKILFDLIGDRGKINLIIWKTGSNDLGELTSVRV